MSGLKTLMGIGLLSLAVLVLIGSGPVGAADYAGAGTGTTSTTAASPGTTGTTASAGTTTASPPAAKPSFFTGGGAFSAHERSAGKAEPETLESYRVKTWRENYLRALKKRQAEKAALKKIRLRRLYPVSALASIQAD